jgi:aspartyl-tRNA(Asn)/glutamyl-tRNA(Gln) amidotransferase subunit A
MDDWLGMTAAELGRGIAGGRIGPVALAEAYLAAIDAHPHRDRIYARVTADRARAEAQAAEARAKAGQRLSPLDGVPVSWKDLFDTAGTATEAGSQLLKGRVPEADALVLRNATALGLVCLGKTHMTELAFSGLGYNPMTATPPCVNDHDAVPGGSSSGAAASVTFGLASAGIGSDTGGSVRVPSAWNDLVGTQDDVQGACRSTASCRSARSSTPSGRSAGRSRTRHCCSPRSKAASRRTSGARRSTARGS